MIKLTEKQAIKLDHFLKTNDEPRTIDFWSILKTNYTYDMNLFNKLKKLGIIENLKIGHLKTDTIPIFNKYKAIIEVQKVMKG